MKKMILFLICTNLFAAPSQYEVLKVPAGGAPVIDGDISEWTGEYFIDSLHSDDNVLLRDALEPWTRDEIQLGVYMAWDDRRFYFAVKIIHDDTLVTTGGNAWAIDNIKVVPAGQTRTFYLGIDGALLVNPSAPYTPGVNFWAAVSRNGNGDFPTYEFSMERDLLGPVQENGYRIDIGTEDNDINGGGETCIVFVGMEYLGDKHDWNSSSIGLNPLEYPLYTLITQEGPPLAVTHSGGNLIPHSGPSLSARPNPFTGRVKLAYQIENTGILGIYDLSGRYLKSFGLNAGSGSVDWDGSTCWGNPAAAGAYLARLQSGNRTKTIRLFTGP